MKIILLFSLFCIFFICTKAHSFEEFSVSFGSLKIINGKWAVVKETATIPFKLRATGYTHGFIVTPSSLKPYEIYAILYPPSEPKKVVFKHINPAKTNNRLIKKPLTEGIRSPKHKRKGSYHFPIWFDPGDPLGIYKIEVYINSKLYKVIEYEVIQNDS